MCVIDDEDARRSLVGAKIRLCFQRPDRTDTQRAIERNNQAHIGMSAEEDAVVFLSFGCRPGKFKSGDSLTRSAFVARAVIGPLPADDRTSKLESKLFLADAFRSGQK